MDKRYLKECMELIGKSGINGTSKIGILLCASKYVSFKFSDQCIQILNNKERINGLIGGTKIQKRESKLKYQSGIYIVQSKFDVNHKSIQMIWNNIRFPSINVIRGKTSLYGRRVL